MQTILVDGVARCRVDQLTIGQRVDLECDMFADPDVFCAAESDLAAADRATEHPEFRYEFEVIMEFTREGDDCIRVDFESGFSCGFPPDHLVDVDGEQRATGGDSNKESKGFGK